MSVTTTYVYTAPGPQRPVFLAPEQLHRFVVRLHGQEVGRVESSCDTAADIKAGRAKWLPYEGGLGGVVQQVTALRLVLPPATGWAELTLQTDTETPKESV